MNPPATAIPLGLIAGQGDLPLATARGMRAAGRSVICCALSGHAPARELRPLCDEFTEVGLLRLNQWVRVLRRSGCREAVMVGRVGANEMHARFHLFRYLPDWRAARVWFVRARHDKRNDRLLAAVAEELESGGIRLIDGRPFVPENLSTLGVMTRTAAAPALQADIDFAWPLLKRASELLIGQALTCKDKAVIAVEAVEGTDRLIERTGQFCKRRGWVLCKAAGPRQDMRFDVPTVGVATVELLHKYGGGALVLEAGRTIMLEKEKLLARADQLGVVVMGLE